MFDELLITQLTVGPGRSPGGTKQKIELSGLTVFVGPNNSGKSLALSEIHRYGSPMPGESWQIVLDPEFTALSADEAEEFLRTFEMDPAAPNLHPGHIHFRVRTGSQQVSRSHVQNALQNPKSQPAIFRTCYIANTTINLNGETRLQLCTPKPWGDLLKPDPFNSLQVLFTREDLRKDVREILHRAFAKYFIIIPTTQGVLRVALADRAPVGIYEEQGLHGEARSYYAGAQPIEQFSDGVKAYTGTIIEILAGNPRVILIDEPEAFLYPPLAQQIGGEISRIVSQSRKNVFASTHSAHFVMGCLQSGAPVDIIRLTYKDGKATARVLKNDELAIMMRNPLLRSAGVINALFYECVVVTESDSDRAFYQEINERLLKYAPGRGIPNCLFLNAQNKQTTKQITKPLRELGIPTISVVDVDILKEGGKVWSGFLESGFLPELDRNAFAISRDNLFARAKTLGLDLKQCGGISQFQKSDKEAADNLFDRLEQYGLFVVRGGELESWLKPLGATRHSPQWLISIFEKLGDDPSDPQFVRPGEGDVWEFIDRMRSWFSNPGRKGMPD
jgi:hypothetical protein